MQYRRILLARGAQKPVVPRPVFLIAMTYLGVACTLPSAAAFLLPAATPTPFSTSSSFSLSSSSASSVCGRQAAVLRTGQTAAAAAARLVVLMKGGKGDEDKDLSAEFSRRLEDEEESLPRVPIRKSSSPAPGGGVPQKVAQRSFSTMPKTQSYNKEDGTDYWMDEKVLEAEKRRKAKRKAPSPDQYPAEKIREEIVSPYKNNWILFISITIFSIAFFAFLFPEELQIPSITIPDFETGAAIPETIK
ncbi:Hypothetical protein NocV09_11000070 [Nannochloropsis oceanica]